ncbi:unnamed protein product [Rotaria sp. Silwood2]|nr:unnamed protein product [Rotaria sp. Silwood2]
MVASNLRVIFNQEDEISNRCEPLYLPTIDNTLSLPRFDNACQTLLDHELLDIQLLEKVNIARNHPNTNQLLTSDEAASIYLYTMKWNDETQGSFYAKLNSTLRTGDENSLKPWLDYLRLFASALFKLPSIESTIVYRCVKGHLYDQYQENTTHVLLSFISCTRSLEDLEENTTMEQCTMFFMKTYSGKMIDKYGGDSGEVLLLPGSRFQVTKINNESKMHIIEMDELTTESNHVQNWVVQDTEIRQRRHENQNEQKVYQETTTHHQPATNRAGKFDKTLSE